MDRLAKRMAVVLRSSLACRTRLVHPVASAPRGEHKRLWHGGNCKANGVVFDTTNSPLCSIIIHVVLGAADTLSACY